METEKDQNLIAQSHQKASLIPECTKPSPETKLWRYMDLTKFLSMIQTSSLYFARPDTFGDPFECAIGLESMKTQYRILPVLTVLLDKAKKRGINLFEQCRDVIFHEEQLYQDKIKSMSSQEEINKVSQLCNDQILIAIIEKARKMGYDDIVESAEQRWQKINDHLPANRTDIYINCWYNSDYESEAMWELYANSTKGQGIAIQTRSRMLENSFSGDYNIQIGEVQYIDFLKRFADPIYPYWFKRKAFEHEREVRAVYESHEDNDRKGISIKVDLDKLIENIYVSPLAEDYFVSVVKDIIKKYEIHKNIKYSSLKDEPFFGR